MFDTIITILNSIMGFVWNLILMGGTVGIVIIIIIILIPIVAFIMKSANFILGAFIKMIMYIIAAGIGFYILYILIISAISLI